MEINLPPELLAQLHSRVAGFGPYRPKEQENSARWEGREEPAPSNSEDRPPSYRRFPEPHGSSISDSTLQYVLSLQNGAPSAAWEEIAEALLEKKQADGAAKDVAATASLAFALAMQQRTTTTEKKVTSLKDTILAVPALPSLPDVINGFARATLLLVNAPDLAPAPTLFAEWKGLLANLAKQKQLHYPNREAACDLHVIASLFFAQLSRRSCDSAFVHFASDLPKHLKASLGALLGPSPLSPKELALPRFLSSLTLCELAVYDLLSATNPVPPDSVLSKRARYLLTTLNTIRRDGEELPGLRTNTAIFLYPMAHSTLYLHTLLTGLLSVLQDPARPAVGDRETRQAERPLSSRGLLGVGALQNVPPQLHASAELNLILWRSSGSDPGDARLADARRALQTWAAQKNGQPLLSTGGLLHPEARLALTHFEEAQRDDSCSEQLLCRTAEIALDHLAPAGTMMHADWDSPVFGARIDRLATLFQLQQVVAQSDRHSLTGPSINRLRKWLSQLKESASIPPLIARLFTACE